MPKHADKPASPVKPTASAPASGEPLAVEWQDPPASETLAGDVSGDVGLATVAAVAPVAIPSPVPAAKAPIAAAAAPKPKAKAAGHTLCCVTGTAVMYQGRIVPVGEVAEFSDDVVLQLPDALVSVE